MMSKMLTIVATENGYTWPLLADEMLGFADALKLERFHAVGNSLGGYCAMSLAARFPLASSAPSSSIPRHPPDTSQTNFLPAISKT